MKSRMALLLIAVAAAGLFACGPGVIASFMSSGGGSSSGPTTFQLTINKAGAGEGTVTSTGGEIDCGGTCLADITSSGVITLLASPLPGFKFTVWTGDLTGTANPQDLVMSAARQVTASFELAPPGFALPDDYTANGNPSSSANADFNRDGILDLAVGSTSGTKISVFLGNANGTFQQPSIPTTTLGGPSALAAGDLDHDGRLDLAVAHNDKLSILIGQGNGSFTTTSTPALGGTGAISIVIGDVNVDGVPDLLVALSNDNMVAVLLGSTSSAGTFLASTLFAVSPGLNPKSLALGDFDCNGKPDLAVANQNTGDVSILLGNGLGGFSSATVFDVETGPRSIAVGEFNSDGKQDLVVANHDASSVSILRGNGNGTFQTAVRVDTTPSPACIAIGDLNHDGKSDLVVANESGSGLSIFIGHGDGTFVIPSADFPVGINSTFVSLGDYDRDGRSDVVVTRGTGLNNVSVLRNSTIIQTSGDFPSSLAKQFVAGSGPRSVTVGDWDCDGKLDLAVANLIPLSSNDGKVSTLRGLGLGNFSQPVAATTVPGTETFFLVADDFDSDGDKDLAVCHRNAGKVSILLGNGAGSFSVASSVSIGGNLRGIVAGDFDSDGDADLVVVNHATNRVDLLVGDGAGSFTLATAVPPFHPVGLRPRAVAIGYLDDDANLDLAVANHDEDSVSILLGSGTGTFFNPAVTVSAAVKPQCVAIGDFDDDGDNDLVLGSEASLGSVSLVLGDGTGAFQLSTEAPAAGFTPFFVAVGDLNADGKTDLAVANSGVDATPIGVGSLSVMLGLGSGHPSGFLFAPATNYPFPAATAPRSIGIGDFNADGRPDLAVGNDGNASITILLNASPP
ncbi:MAG TPA: VCBS repeat-containing protein [Planctomycetota bacterium]|nr:VCBS repeat-containing protein [Planctomycetota bacterium]